MKATRVAYGEALRSVGAENRRIVVFDADVGNATNTQTFQKEFPERYYQMGIAEANMVCVAAGISDMGYVPFVSAFAVFGIGRALDQVRNTVAYGKYNVKLAMTHCGITGGPDGGSHQSVEDLAIMRAVPGIRIFCPCDTLETQKAVKLAAELEGPVYIRLSRMATPEYEEHDFRLGGSQVMREGRDAVIFTCGTMVSQSLEAAEILQKEGIGLSVVNLYSLKPVDEERILAYAVQCKNVITVEEHSIYGGVGDAVSCVLEEYGSYPHKRIGIVDRFGTSAEPEVIVREYGLDGEGIAAQIRTWLTFRQNGGLQ